MAAKAASRTTKVATLQTSFIIHATGKFTVSLNDLPSDAVTDTT